MEVEVEDGVLLTLGVKGVNLEWRWWICAIHSIRWVKVSNTKG